MFCLWPVVLLRQNDKLDESPSVVAKEESQGHLLYVAAKYN
jgi:hypothetical protein